MAQKIVGDGPMASTVLRMSQTIRGVEYLGSQPKERVASLMREARLLIIPSLWYEGFPMIVVEAYAVGLPIIASSLGGLSSLITHGRTGRLFQAGNSDDLCRQVEWVHANRDELSRMRIEARQEFQEKYTAQQNYELLMKIYARAGSEKN
jgi:glycosyltransferase involved in cell wall biosynthesis